MTSPPLSPGPSPLPRGLPDPRAALLIGPQPEEQRLMKAVFRQQGWKLCVADTLHSAVAQLRKTPVAVVITERILPQGDWKDVLARTRDLPRPPLLVVTARHADDYLWAEVLNWGGHDVLVQPLRESEVVRVLQHAFGIRRSAASG